MKFKLLLAFGLVLSLTVNTFAQSFYDLNSIQSIEITFAQSNWDQLLDAEKAGNDGYIMATAVNINGTVFDSVGVKYKGNSTYSANQVKNPFHIELDTYKDQDYQGYKDIKLSNVKNDPSFVREALSYQIIRQYMDAPLSNYANVKVNGSLIGLYVSSEAISKTFLKDRFDSKKNTFVKCNPPAGAGPQTNDFPNLTYQGTDSANYEDAYEIKSDFGWNELIALTDTLNNNFTAIESILDVDRALWMLALDNVLVNLDSYIGAFAQNYYLYKSDFDQFIPIIWDLNESFGVFSQTGTITLNSTTSKQQLTHLLHENDADYPLMKQLMSVPMYKRMYLAHVKTILLENFDDGSYLVTGQTFQTLIASAVQADNNKFFTYANFTANLNSDVSGGGGPGGGSSYPGISNLMNARSSYLLNQSDFTATEPTITNVIPSTTTPNLNDVVSINATITNENAVYIGYRDNVYAPFTRTLMFDDGNHNDGLAGDGVYGFDLSMTNLTVQYYIYAENAAIGKFSPARAEYEYHTLTSYTPPVGDIVINEFQADNETTITDQDGEYDDWIELYNNTNVAIDLSGYFLSDDQSDLTLWEFPQGTSIAANGYLIVWADKDLTQTGLHADFKLSSSGETIFLSDNAGTLIDQVAFGSQTTDFTMARFPNGTGDFIEMYPTFNSVNVDVTSVQAIEPEVSFKIYPNPSQAIINILVENSLSQESVLIFNMQGKLMLQTTINQNMQLDISNWAKGTYIIQLNNSTKQFIKS